MYMLWLCFLLFASIVGGSSELPIFLQNIIIHVIQQSASGDVVNICERACLQGGGCRSSGCGTHLQAWQLWYTS